MDQMWGGVGFDSERPLSTNRKRPFNGWFGGAQIGRGISHYGFLVAFEYASEEKSIVVFSK